MSYHWENTIWQSRDGSWNRGYFERINVSDSIENKEGKPYDPEWDDEFNFSKFADVKTGFPNESAAAAWTPYGNPRGAIIYHYAGNSMICKDLDKMAHYFINPEARAKREKSVHNRLRREHFRALEKQWAELGGLEDKRVSVVVSDDDRVYELGGQTYTGYPKKKGDWLTVENKRVFNTRTGHFHWRIASVTESPEKRAIRNDNVHSIGTAARHPRSRPIVKKAKANAEEPALEQTEKKGRKKKNSKAAEKEMAH